MTVVRTYNEFEDTVLHEESHTLFLSPDIIRTIRSENIRQAAYAAGIGEVRNDYEVLVGILEEKMIVETRRMWEITMHLKETWCSGVG
jgi:hypothetical protein